MKTAIYIEDGTVQLVITPETEFEKNAMSTFQDRPLSAQIFTGAFYDCRGGWVRQKSHFGYTDYGFNREDQSLILRIAEHQEPEIPKAGNEVATGTTE